MTGEGVPDLLTVMMGLSQRYMKEEMEIDVAGPGVGTVLEVKEEKGFGTTIDTVLYDRTIRSDDTIVVGGQNEPIVTEVRALLQPRPLAEIRTESRFEKVDEVSAASGIKVAAPELADAMAGAPVRVVRDRDLEEVVAEVQAELADIAVDTAEEGVVVKADTLGSLEAMADALGDAEVPIVRAEVGDVAPQDVSVASTAEDGNRRPSSDSTSTCSTTPRPGGDRGRDDLHRRGHLSAHRGVRGVRRGHRKAQQDTILENITRPARFRILPDHTFRQNDPAVVGVEERRNGPEQRERRQVRW